MTDEEKEDKIWEENSIPLTKDDKEELLKLTVKKVKNNSLKWLENLI